MYNSNLCTELQNSIDIHAHQISSILSPYDPTTATYAWFDTLRAIEDCINLVTIDWEDDAFEQRLFSLPLAPLLHDPRPLLALRPRLITRFSETFANRFTNLMVQSSAIAHGFAALGLFEMSVELATVGAAIHYFQSRRRHFVALLHSLPNECRGRQKVVPLDALNIILPIIEMNALQIVGAQQALLIEAARERLGLAHAQSLEIAMLDGLFLEPERSRITEMPVTEQGMAILGTREPQPTDRLFSAAELRNDIVVIEAAYAEFDLAATEFGPASELIRRISCEYVERDFWVAIKPKRLKALFGALNVPQALRAALLPPPAGYNSSLETYAPFVLVDGTYRSTVSLLSRFVYYWRMRCLDGRKRFQIRTGFIFEKAVAAALEAQGFSDQKITRINRHEFDVVALRNGVIWNVQCKNNFIDLEWVQADSKRFAKYNRSLVRLYERALTKERNREDILTAHLSIDTIQHMVVSRFPVVTDNARIIPFSRMGEFARRVDALL